MVGPGRLELEGAGWASSVVVARTRSGRFVELARDFTTFYESCRVLDAEEPVRSNRLARCQLTARTLNHGLSLLGITAPDRR